MVDRWSVWKKRDSLSNFVHFTQPKEKQKHCLRSVTDKMDVQSECSYWIWEKFTVKCPRWQMYRTFSFDLWSVDLLLHVHKFLKVTLVSAMLLGRIWGRVELFQCALTNVCFRGCRSPWFPLLTGFRFVEFDMSFCCFFLDSILSQCFKLSLY